MLLIQVIWMIFDAETDVKDLSDVNYKSDIDMQNAGTAPCIG